MLLALLLCCLLVLTGKYDEGGLEALDYVIASASKHGIKLILSFIDNWKYYNGVDQFVDWCIPARAMPPPKESGGDTDTDVSGCTQSTAHVGAVVHIRMGGDSAPQDDNKALPELIQCAQANVPNVCWWRLQQQQRIAPSTLLTLYLCAPPCPTWLRCGA